MNTGKEATVGMQVDQIPVQSWEKFVASAAAYDIGSPVHPTFIFRGQSDANWPLHPSLVRLALKSGLNSEKAIELESAALDKFREVAHLYLPPSTIPHQDDLVSWWILMQHYGAPTRVLDWTESPFVALYFAALGEWNRSGAVWLIHVGNALNHFEKTHEEYDFSKAVKNPKQFLEPGTTPVLYFLKRKTQTDRMGVQQMQTTVSTQVLADHGKTLEAILPDRKEIVQFSKLIIPGKLKPEFMRRLRTMNVTARALFPGIDGLGRSVSELITLGCLYGSAEEINGRGHAQQTESSKDMRR